MKTNDYVKYLTQTVIRHIEQPKKDRKKLKEERKREKSEVLKDWFGVIPYMFERRTKKGS